MKLKLVIYAIAILPASISFVTVWGDCDQGCIPLNASLSTTNSQSFDGAVLFARCYSICTGAGFQWGSSNSSECFGACSGSNPTCSTPSCVIGMQDDHGPPPATPTDSVTYIRYTIRNYRLSINFTDFPPGIAYVVRLFTNATNVTSYFFVLPNVPFTHDIMPSYAHYCNVSSWSYATVNSGGISNFSSPVEECLNFSLPVITNINTCYGLDLRPGYTGHFYAYVTWDIDTAAGVELSIYASDGTNSSEGIFATVQNKRSFKVQSISTDMQLINLGTELNIMIFITTTGTSFHHRDAIFEGALQCTNQEKVPDVSASVVQKIVHPNCTYGFVINVTLGYDPVVLEDVSVLTVLVMNPGSVDTLALQSFHRPYNTARLMRPMYPEIENYTCQCDRNYVHYTCESACTSMDLTGSNYTECLSSCDDATTSSNMFNIAALDPGDYEIDVQVRFHANLPYHGNVPNSPPLLPVTFEKCPATKPQNISYNFTRNFININWIPPSNTYQRSIVHYVVFVGDVGDNISQRSFEHLETDRRYTQVNRSDTNVTIEFEMPTESNLSIRVRADTTLTEGEWSDEIIVVIDNNNGSTSSSSGIIGGAVGGVIVLLIIIIVVLCIVILCTRRSLKKEAFHVYDEISTKLNTKVIITNKSHSVAKEEATKYLYSATNSVPTMPYSKTTEDKYNNIQLNECIQHSELKETIEMDINPSYGVSIEDGAVAFNTKVTDSDISAHQLSQQCDYDYVHDESGELHHNTTTATDNLRYHTTVDQSHETKAVIYSPYLPPIAKQTGKSEYGVINQPHCDHDPSFDIAVDQSHTAEFCLPVITNNAGEGKYGVINQPQCDNDPNFDTTYGVINQPQCDHDPSFDTTYGVINQPQCDYDPSFDTAVDQSHTAEFCLPVITNNTGEGKYGVINQPQCDNDPNFDTTYGVINQPQCDHDPSFDTAVDQSHTAEFCLPVITNNADEGKYGVIYQPQCDNDPNFDTTINQNHTTESLIANNIRLIGESKYGVINQSKCDDPICDTTVDQNHTKKSYLSFISNKAKLTGEVKYGIINQPQCVDPNYFDPTTDQRRTSPLPYLPLIADNAKPAGEGDCGVINQPQCDDVI